MSILTHNCRVDQHSLTTLAGERLKSRQGSQFVTSRPTCNLPTLQPGGPARPHLPKLPRKRLGSCQGGPWRPEITDGSYCMPRRVAQPRELTFDDQACQGQTAMSSQDSNFLPQRVLCTCATPAKIFEAAQMDLIARSGQASRKEPALLTASSTLNKYNCDVCVCVCARQIQEPLTMAAVRTGSVGFLQTTFIMTPLPNFRSGCKTSSQTSKSI